MTARSQTGDLVEWVTVARAADVPAGTMVGIEVDGADVILAHVGERFVALSDECTHAGCPLLDGELDLARNRIVCWCHGSEYDVLTGRAVGPPAQEPLKVYRVRLLDDEVQVTGAELAAAEGSR